MEKLLFKNVSKSMISSNAKVAILISVFNSEKTLDSCFESIAKQSFQDFIIVCINDASKDGSSHIIQKWEKHFGEKFLSLENKENLGLTRSLNKGLHSITNPYTARIDSDDWWDSSKLEKQVAFLEENPTYGLIGTWYQNVFGEKKKDVTSPITNKEIKEKIFGYNPFAHSTVMFSTQLVKDLGGYNESIYYGQDYELWLRLLPKTNFYNIPEILCYRTGDSGISKEHQNKQIFQYLKTQWKYIHLHQYPLKTYLHLLRPLLVLLCPKWIKKVKYHFFS